MQSIAMTGANGFLGWHTRAAALSQGTIVRSIPVGDEFSISDAAQSISGASRLVHIAGVNRATDEEVVAGNRHFAEQIASALRVAPAPPPRVVFANSTQAGNGSAYGEAKRVASGILGTAAEDVGAQFVDVVLPNLFGEHGVPFYNSVVATFCHLLASRGVPSVEQDRDLTLMHAQDAADLMLGVIADAAAPIQHANVSTVLERLTVMATSYAIGDIPDISAKFDRDLFNTYRSFAFASQSPIALKRHADDRGSFFEIVRSHGGSGQSSFSTTVPGVSRGDHYHRRKIERFTVLAGEATISLRRLFSEKVHAFAVSGERPQAIDMPTMWAHNIVNTGASELYTSFWANEIFDPVNPDTFAEAV
ncbi:polysaccharide biosynthesis C-terminal domain-containing protein [Rathayibacter soli]|uniref:polysaccharide biosynthesis C-terminal domain-containing protein n=1 Tax=Rathayibacter soli TaxID=3144168 RepID=UPI0027E522AE|nr:NAD-dependent epimerase/dehydratase family protein [Glaciibacter superstes]